MNNINKRILILEDDTNWFNIINERIQYEYPNIKVDHAFSIQEALQLIIENQYGLIIVDNYLLPSEEESFLEKGKPYETFKSGLSFTKYVKRKYPSIDIICLSVINNPEIKSNYKALGCDYFLKSNFQKSETSFFDQIDYFIKNGKLNLQKPSIFIVHGHDHTTKLELKNYLQNTLNFSEPIILDEQPSKGRTIIEKFEEVAELIDLVFILLTPDDTILSNIDGTQIIQPRPNVLFELGYFYGKLSRKSGKVILLSKSPISLPSDISGVIYVNIIDGINSKGEEIRRELEEYLD